MSDKGLSYDVGLILFDELQSGRKTKDPALVHAKESAVIYSIAMLKKHLSKYINPVTPTYNMSKKLSQLFDEQQTNSLIKPLISKSLKYRIEEVAQKLP